MERMASEVPDAAQDRRSALSLVRSYRSWVILVVAAALIVWLPGSRNDKGTTVGGLTSARAGVVAGGATVGGQAASGGSAEEGADAANGGGAGGGAQGGVGAGGTAGAAPMADVKGYPGLNTPEALASPKCDRERQRARFPSNYTPPCARPWPKGADNGGATAQGVTPDKIKVVVYHDPWGPDDTRALSYERYKEIVTKQFNMFQAYENYGRQFDVQFYPSSGTDEVAQRADAIQIANKTKPFIAIFPDFTQVRRVWAAELAARGVIVWTPTLTVAESNQRPGYRWGAGPDDKLHALLVGEYVAKRLYGQPAKWAGDPAMKAQPRKFGLLYDEVWDRKTFEATLQHFKPGAVVADAVSHDPQADVTALQEAARVQMARFKSKGVNNIITVAGIFPTLYFTQAATAQNYFPEWTVTGWGQSDNSVTGKLYDQQQWRNAFGMGMVMPFVSPTTDGEYVYQYKWMYGQTLTAGEQGYVSQSYTLIFPIALGVHMAGPHLTMETFQAGLFALPPVGGPWCGCVAGYGAVSFGRHIQAYAGEKTAMFEDATEKWWDPNTVGNDEIGLTAPGVWRFVNGAKRYIPGQIPTGEPPMFNPAGTVTGFNGYQSLPPNDRYPRYEK
jgi:hypothetical protein